jgi:hypothetical protein
MRLLFKSPSEIPKESEREIVHLPNGRHLVSVEKALNSRCTSDYDNEQNIFHWGIFDQTRRLSDDQLSELVDEARIPRFTKHSLEITRERNILTFVTDYDLPEEQKQWLMVESGMLQQAVCLLCAASGIGMVFKSLGPDGSRLNSHKLAVICMKLDAVKPSYDGEYWSTYPPRGERPWTNGNMKGPQRDGNVPLRSAIEDSRLLNASGKIASNEDLSQLLWAARGRTPHFYKSRPWGMTIPTSQGRQDRSGVFVISDRTLYRYDNWYQNRPTHSITMIHHIEPDTLLKIQAKHRPLNRFIVIVINEKSGNALWEVGFQLFNLIIQARALDIAYEALLWGEEQRQLIERIGIRNPIAGFAI